jgi:hypothetical protein
MKKHYLFVVILAGMAFSQIGCSLSQDSMPSAPTPACVPSVITPYMRVDQILWISASAVTVNSGEQVDLGPQADPGGSWNWTGPNRFGSHNRGIDQVHLSEGLNSYVANYTNARGCQSAVTFLITVNP